MRTASKSKPLIGRIAFGAMTVPLAVISAFLIAPTSSVAAQHSTAPVLDRDRKTEIREFRAIPRQSERAPARPANTNAWPPAFEPPSEDEDEHKPHPHPRGEFPDDRGVHIPMRRHSKRHHGRGRKLVCLSNVRGIGCAATLKSALKAVGKGGVIVIPHDQTIRVHKTTAVKKGVTICGGVYPRGGRPRCQEKPLHIPGINRAKLAFTDERGCLDLGSKVKRVAFQDLAIEVPPNQLGPCIFGPAKGVSMDRVTVNKDSRLGQILARPLGKTTLKDVKVSGGSTAVFAGGTGSVEIKNATFLGQDTALHVRGASLNLQLAKVLTDSTPGADHHRGAGILAEDGSTVFVIRSLFQGQSIGVHLKRGGLTLIYTQFLRMQKASILADEGRLSVEHTDFLCGRKNGVVIGTNVGTAKMWRNRFFGHWNGRALVSGGSIPHKGPRIGGNCFLGNRKDIVGEFKSGVRNYIWHWPGRPHEGTLYNFCKHRFLHKRKHECFGFLKACERDYRSDHPFYELPQDEWQDYIIPRRRHHHRRRHHREHPPEILEGCPAEFLPKEDRKP